MDRIAMTNKEERPVYSTSLCKWAVLNGLTQASSCWKATFTIAPLGISFCQKEVSELLHIADVQSHEPRKDREDELPMTKNHDKVCIGIPELF